MLVRQSPGVEHLFSICTHLAVRAPSFTSLDVSVWIAFSSRDWNSLRPRPGGMGGRKEITIVPGRRRNCRRGQNRPGVERKGDAGNGELAINRG